METAGRPRHKTEDRARLRRGLIIHPGCAGPAPGSAFNENGKAGTVLKLLGLFWESAALFEAHGNIFNQTNAFAIHASRKLLEGL